MIEHILKKIAPNAQYTIVNEKESDYTIIWYSKDIQEPTKDEIDAEVLNYPILLKKDEKLNDILLSYQTESTKTITYKNVVYKGGESSASAIAGAVTLAQSLGETEVKIIALDDSENFMSFSEALELSGMIAKSWRDAFFRYKKLKRAVLAASSVEELELIKW
uniref:hypothetical protein n=1 Tax=Aliarcobacter sp. TaxID=2321116 RepID=UPI0040472EAF